MQTLIRLEFQKDWVLPRTENGITEVFDPVRRTWVLLTPEEWVRQHMIHYLIAKKYPASLIAIEKKIMLGDLVKRCDIVVYSRDAQPFMIIECKRMEVPLSQQTLDQVLRYHIPLQPPYLLITNGAYCMGLKKENNQFESIDYFPEYEK